MSRPLNNIAIARSLARLDVGERLFLWGFRAIAQCHRLGWPSMSEIRQVYDHFGVADAAPSLHAMLKIFACTGLTAVELHSPGCPCVSDSERLLLQAVAAAQRDEKETARRRFGYWLPSAAADWILEPACGLGRLFAARGLMLRSPGASFASRPDVMATQSSSIGSPTLH